MDSRGLARVPEGVIDGYVGSPFDEVMAGVEALYTPANGGTGEYGFHGEQPFPVSVTRIEGRHLANLVTAKHARNVFELCTGTGYSTCWLGLAVRELGGFVTTMDGYGEERQQNLVPVRDNVEAVTPNQHTLRRALSMLGIEEYVGVYQGWSPEDVPRIALPGIDLAFIDGDHEGDQPWLDFCALEPFLAPGAWVVWHDNHAGCPAVGRAIARTGLPARPLHTHYGLTLTCLS